jgi:hypothetical protein
MSNINNKEQTQMKVPKAYKVADQFLRDNILKLTGITMRPMFEPKNSTPNIVNGTKTDLCKMLLLYTLTSSCKTMNMSENYWALMNLSCKLVIGWHEGHGPITKDEINSPAFIALVTRYQPIMKKIYTFDYVEAELKKITERASP